MTHKHRSGCLICGEPLCYLDTPQEVSCGFCQIRAPTEVLCQGGHFVCDDCHSQEALPVIERLCLQSAETDMISLFAHVRRHPALAVHGPEHHSLVPATILTTYRNLGGSLADDAICKGIRRGAAVPGGFCAFSGGCGAAMGVGIAFAILIGASPLQAVKRQQVQRIAAGAIEAVSRHQAARCCQRDGWVALRHAATISEPIIGLKLRAETALRCSQQQLNKQCGKENCPLWSQTCPPGPLG